MPSTDPRIDCRRCRHYFVTWDTHFPCGCRFFDFKAKRMPSITVWEATGEACEHFVLKTAASAKKRAPDR